MLFGRQQKKTPVSPDNALVHRVREYINKNFCDYEQTEPDTRDFIQIKKTADIQENIREEKTTNAEVFRMEKPYSYPDSFRSVVAVPEQRNRSLEELFQNMGESFQARLLRLIDERGWTDAQAYKKAGKDKKLFHKIRSNPAYQPSKHTVFAFALGLELSVDETVDLLASAGFAFSPCSRFDLIVKYALEHNIYDLYTVDCILYELGEEAYFCCQK
ncbi:MAG: hypothetical protein J6A77_12615 [Lachnospiraceae bacterium]|nr:hypothetical protein [Lachnospiraceae bacterium]